MDSKLHDKGIKLEERLDLTKRLQVYLTIMKFACVPTRTKEVQFLYVQENVHVHENGRKVFFG